MEYENIDIPFGIEVDASPNLTISMENFQISPALPPFLAFDTTTGAITEAEGQEVEPFATKSFTVSAHALNNPGAIYEDTFTLTIGGIIVNDLSSSQSSEEDEWTATTWVGLALLILFIVIVVVCLVVYNHKTQSAPIARSSTTQ